MSSIECLVIGGGLAGAMTAMRLARAGREVLLLEKERAAHHKVCGEFLSPEAVAYLSEAGVNPLRLGAERARRLRLAEGERCVEAALPFMALSLSRKVLDEALLMHAVETGCEVRRGDAVERLEKDGDLWRAELTDGEQVDARTVFLATGKHDLRGWRRDVESDFVGFKLHWRLTGEQTAGLRDKMELFLFRGGYGGITLIENGLANLCLVVRRAVLHEAGGWAELLETIRESNRQLRSKLEGAKPEWERPLAIGWIPYGYSARGLPGVWRVGDQAAVIPSFTGDGMAIALHSGALAAEMYLTGMCAEDFQRRLGQQLQNGMRLAGVVSRAMVTPAAQRLALGLLPAVPQAMRWIAGKTRVPGRVLLATPVEQAF
jgi:menaquinone-9 beta-reductase